MVLAIRRQVLGEEHPDTAGSFSSLGGLLQAMRDLAGARPYYERALAICLKVLGEERPTTANTLNNLGLLLYEMGDLAGARPYHERALAIYLKVLGEDHPDTARSLNNLALLLQAMGDLAGARPYLERALASRLKVLGEDHHDTAQSLDNLGVLLVVMGDLAGARPYQERALAAYLKVLGEDHPDTAISLSNLAILEATTGRAAVAFDLMKQAAAIDDRMIGQVFSMGSERQRLAFLGGVQAGLQHFLSLVYHDLADVPEAVRAALALVLRRKALTAEALAAQRDAILGGRYPQLRGPLEQLTQRRRQIAQKTLSGPGPGETPDTHRDQLAQWHAEVERLETELAQQLPEVNLERQLRAADRRAVALALPEGVALVEFVRFHNFDFHAVLAQSEQGLQPDRYLAFVLPAGQPDQVWMIDLGEAAFIDQMIADFRRGITGEPAGGRGLEPYAAPEAPAAAGTALRQTLFDPLSEALAGRTRLLLCPDGDLTRLPFELLPAGTNGDRLLDRYEISYLTSGRDVLRFGAASTGQPTQPLIAADPDFDLGRPPAGPPKPSFWSRFLGRAGKLVATVASDSPPVSTPVTGAGRCSRDLERGRRAERLPDTRIEGQEIASLLGVKAWLDQTVLDAQLKAVRSPRILHLATHGFFLEDQPHDPNQDRRNLAVIGAADRLAGANWENPLLRSGLLLAGFNTWRTGGDLPAEAEDGMLTAEDVTGLDLLDTELVVLSACDTGLGAVHAGEGVFGLRRAFVVAGAKTLVMSLWKVPDQQTQELMVDFYRRLLAGTPRAQALREAQLELRKHHPHPFYWGAFICQGDPGPLRFPGPVAKTAEVS
jgi:CHAT domain-containing protein/tetratricopeptide (TPR) repeat protein